MTSDQEAYNELCAYTIAHARRDPSFIHQHIVDAYAAQTADTNTKPITLTFALVGLFLHVEKGWTGKRVQQAHMQLARQKQAWPAIALPADRGSMTAVDVMRAPDGPERDRAIDAWCASVWDAYAADNRRAVAEVLTRGRIIS